MPTLTRGPLPPGVYWRRRLFTLLLAGTLVFVVASWLGGGSDGASDDAPVARQAAGEPASQTVTVPEREGRKQKSRRVRPGVEQGPTFDPSVLAEPEGPCEAADILVTPEVEDAVAGRDVTIGLRLQTVESEACTWRLTPDRVALKITDGDDEVWTSRHCPQALPSEEVVVRRVVATVVEMTWRGKESDEGCPGNTDWVMDGDYTIAAAALGGEPRETEFDLASPTPETITPDPGQKGDKRDGGEKRRDRDRGGDESRDWEAGDAGGAGGNDEPTR